MRFYPKDQGLSAFLSELAAQRAQKKSLAPPPIESAGGRVAGDRDSRRTHAIPHEKFSAPQHPENFFWDGKGLRRTACPLCNKLFTDDSIHTCSPQLRKQL